MSGSNLLWTSDELAPVSNNLLEQVVDRGNMIKACRRVVSNGGSPGVDGMSTKELWGWLQNNHERLAKSLLEGSYHPQPTRLAEIEKPGGGKRWVVNVDLSKFFDEVNHDVLMAKIKRRGWDKRMLKLIDRYLRTGIMLDGVASPRSQGTPQGSPLSPLLSNILLNELDKELERRGHNFCRYADDFVIFVKSEKAAQRVYDSVVNFIEKKLKLWINRSKSQITKHHKLTFLGFGFLPGDQARLRVPKENQKRFRKKAKLLFRMGRGMNLRWFINKHLNPFLRGWANYYRSCKGKTMAEELDSWLRRRLRLINWRQWKRPYTRYKRFITAGFDHDHAMQCAYNERSSWWNSGAQHMNFVLPKAHFANLGLVSLLAMIFKR